MKISSCMKSVGLKNQMSLWLKSSWLKSMVFKLPELKSQELKCIATFNMAISLSELKPKLDHNMLKRAKKLSKLKEGCLMISFTNIF